MREPRHYGGGDRHRRICLVFVGLLVIIRKTSPLNVLTKSWASFILYFVIETIALLVVLFGGLLTTV